MPLGSRVDFGNARYAGCEVLFACDITDSLQQALLSAFDFLVLPLVHPRYRRPSPHATNARQIQAPFTRSDLLLTSAQWSSQIVGKVSPWIRPDSNNPRLKRDSEAALRQELEWAAHLNLQACILPIPLVLDNANYARILLQVMHGLSNMALWVRVSLGDDTTDQQDMVSKFEIHFYTVTQSINQWNQIRELCDYHARLGLILELPENLPDKSRIERWVGEPVRAIVLSTSIFQTNRKGYPTLSKAFQEVVLQFFRLNVQVIVSGQARHSLNPPTLGPNGSQAVRVDVNRNLTKDEHQLRIYHEYLSYLFRKPELPSQQFELELSYRDYLQAPLQPLQDNLESHIYETFERDTQKYEAYREAVEAALIDRVPSAEAETRTTVLMVVGAGRGPLVKASLKAAENCGRQIRVFAVEKNPNAVITLQNLLDSEGWEGKVTIVAADMRHWEAPEKADILVSELLGSFGDNELSPECLDGAQRFLREDGVSIPTSYTSYLQPVTTTKLWNDVRAYNDREHFETPYVVKMHKFTALSGTQEVFTFKHPNRDVCIDNSRSCLLEFERLHQPAAICHGFAGYFDAQLYGKVHLSTHPPTHTPNMFSWFPLFFPLKKPLYCPAGASISLTMWRCTAAHKVWYEWAVLKPSLTDIHNSTGRSYYVGL